ncbi:MAG TPA: permease-like cell division protein FtsX [Candidatus Saccharimonadales bacterium]|nr:permease-like cell division protein FtsX [Candidatus Saccharimonadales bacterium]
MRRSFITFLRIVHTGAKSLLRNSWLSTAATAIMAVTLTIIVLTFVANMTFNGLIQSFTSKIDVAVYLNDNITPQQLAGFEKELRASPNVASVSYTSKAQALASWEKANSNNLSLQNALSQVSNPLPASIQVTPKDPNQLQSIANIVGEPANLNLQSGEPSYSGVRKQAINRIVSIAHFIRIVGIGASAVFAIISILIIFNTIRMAIFNRRDEIEIMKLIGASKWYIRGPFIVEAALYGVIAGAITLAFTMGLLDTQVPNIATYIPQISSTSHYFSIHRIWIMLAVIGVGMLIGILSSLLATQRYLKMHATPTRRRFLGRRLSATTTRDA